MDKVNIENILFVNKCIINLLPPIFNDWFTFLSTQYHLQSLKTLPSAKIKQLITDEILKKLLNTVFNHDISVKRKPILLFYIPSLLIFTDVIFFVWH